MIPNKYPAVSLEESASSIAAAAQSRSLAGHGIHEVIIESPGHTASFSELTEEQARWACVAYRDRLASVAGFPSIRQAILFKNCRGGGGATLEHTHSQLIGTSIVSPGLERELESSQRYYEASGGCIFCSMIQDELADGLRIVEKTERLVAFCPFASRFPYEVWILPIRHQSRFEAVTLAEIGELSALLRKLVVTLEKIIPQVPYNYWFHSSPFDTISYDHYHWHLELISRSTTQAGFEWGTGCFVNPLPPENAASALRARWE